MNFIALRMLIGDRAKYLGIIMGLTFASLLITQQAAIFWGLMSRTYGFIDDTGGPDLWVMDGKVDFVDDIKPMQDTVLTRVRGIDGVASAVPMYKGLIKARLPDGKFQTCNLVGLDDTSLTGGPPVMVEGSLADLRRSEGVIVDAYEAARKLARPVLDEKGNPKKDAKGKPITVPLKVGDVLELNDRRAIVVGLCEVSKTFASQPMIYTTYSRATQFAPAERRKLSFVLVDVKEGQNVRDVAARITAETELKAMTGPDFASMTYWYFMKSTGIPINFGIAIFLGFIVGTAIAGQTFYNFTLDNLRHFGALKAMGTSNFTLLRMILLQGALTGIIGYGLGVGAAALFGVLGSKGELAFLLPMQLLIGTGVSIVVICVLASLLSIVKVIRLEPAIVFKG